MEGARLDGVGQYRSREVDNFGGAGKIGWEEIGRTWWKGRVGGGDWHWGCAGRERWWRGGVN